MNAIDFGIATGITSPMQFFALLLLVLFQIVFFIFYLRQKKQESDQKHSDAELEQRVEQAQRRERLLLTEQYTKSVANMNETLKDLNETQTKTQQQLVQLKELFDGKLETLTNEYIGEVSQTMANELVNLTMDSAKNRILLFCAELIKNNHILDNEQEVKNRIQFYINQDFTKDLIRLKLFRYRSKAISSAMEPEWRDNLIKGIQDRILKVQQGDVVVTRNLDNFIKDSFESYKTKLKESIDSF